MDDHILLYRIIPRSLWIWLLTWPLISLGEGTAQLMPAGSGAGCVSYVQGNDGTGKEGPGFERPWYDKLYVHIEDPESEIIYYGFTRKEPTNKDIYYRILTPDGDILCAGKVANSNRDSGYVADDGIQVFAGPRATGGGTGYTALQCRPTMAGDYAIVFNVGSPTTVSTSGRYFVHPLDITVADISEDAPRVIDGRLFSYKWHLNTASGSNDACMQFYTWTPDSMVVMMDMNQMEPYGYSVSFNSYGVFNTGDIESDRLSTNSASLAVPEYRVFVNAPDSVAYPTGTPGRITYLEVNGCHADSEFCIEVFATKLGEINVFIDLNGNGVYEEGTEDRYFPFNNTEIGAICVPWDGLDGRGNQVAGGSSGEIVVQFLAGVVHFPVYDPENNRNGFNCAVIRPAALSPLMYYDNRGTEIGTHNLTGCASDCNVWTSNRGDRIMVNTWVNTITSRDTAAFVLADLCPPQAAPDTTCVSAGFGVEISILDNDSDSDNALDPAGVTLLSLSDSASSAATYYAASQSVFFRTDSTVSDSVWLRYQVCDVTNIADGGPLCDEAEVLIAVFDGCLNSAILAPMTWEVKAQRERAGVMLRWDIQRSGQAPFWIERAAQGEPFTEVERVGGRSRHYLDQSGGTMGDSMVYRLRTLDAAGRWQYSPQVLIAPAGSPLWLTVYPQADGLALIRYQSQTPGYLMISDTQGRTLWRSDVKQGIGPIVRRVPIAEWASGMYYLRLMTQDGRIRKQTFRIP